MTLSRSIGILLLVVTVVVAVIAIVLWFQAPHRTRVEISGVVIDAKTDVPIHRAKVMVSLHRIEFPYESNVAKIGMFTDDRGHFSLKSDSLKPFHDVLVEASTPSNQYGYSRSTGLESGIVVKTAPLPIAIQDHWTMNYERFGGAATDMGVKEIEFIGEGWNVEKP